MVADLKEGVVWLFQPRVKSVIQNASVNTHGGPRVIQGVRKKTSWEGEFGGQVVVR